MADEVSTVAAMPAGKRKLSFNEKRELAGLPAAIEACEAQIAALHEEMADPQFYQQGGAQLAAAQTRLQQLEEQLASAYQRWEVLEQHE